jgi:hypothetical protein
MLVKWGYCLLHYTGVNVMNNEGAKNLDQTGKHHKVPVHTYPYLRKRPCSRLPLPAIPYVVYSPTYAVNVEVHKNKQRHFCIFYTNI